jgi:hypothetical protein
MTITANRPTLTEAERAQARADLNHDERIFHNASIEEALDDIEREIARIRRIARNIPTDHESAALALELVEAVGRQYKPRGKVASIMHLLGLVQDSAVRQARAHSNTWDEIAEKLGETRPNLIARFKD